MTYFIPISPVGTVANRALFDKGGWTDTDEWIDSVQYIQTYSSKNKDPNMKMNMHKFTVMGRKIKEAVGRSNDSS